MKWNARIGIAAVSRFLWMSWHARLLHAIWWCSSARQNTSKIQLFWSGLGIRLRQRGKEIAEVPKKEERNTTTSHMMAIMSSTTTVFRSSKITGYALQGFKRWCQSDMIEWSQSKWWWRRLEWCLTTHLLEPRGIQLKTTHSSLTRWTAISIVCCSLMRCKQLER